MACTSVVAVSPSTVQANTVATMTVTITNGGASSLTVTNIQPTAIKTGGSQKQTCGVNFGSVPIGTGLNVTVAGSSGTLAVPIGLVSFVGTTGPYGGGSGTLTLGALVTMSDGTNHVASTTTITVNSLASTYEDAEQTSPQPVAYGSAS